MLRGHKQHAREENSSDLFLITITSQPLTASPLTLRQNIAVTDCERHIGLHTIGVALYILMLMSLLQFLLGWKHNVSVEQGGEVQIFTVFLFFIPL